MRMPQPLRTALASMSLCALATTAAGAATAAEAAKPKAGDKVLATVQVEKDHVIEFRELSSGALAVSESAKAEQAPVLGDKILGKSMSDIYRQVRPGEQVPEALTAAEGRLAARKPKGAKKKPPKPEAHGAGKGPHLLTAAEQAWFKKDLCVSVYGQLSLVNCIQGYSWVHSGSHESAIFLSQSMVGSEGVTAEVTIFWWNGSGWALLTSAHVKPGTYWYDYVTYDEPFSWYVNLDGAGNNTLVSQDVKSCGNGGQWACTTNCQGTISCNPENTSDCEILGAAGQSFCVAN